MRTLKLTQILGQPCAFQVEAGVRSPEDTEALRRLLKHELQAAEVEEQVAEAAAAAEEQAAEVEEAAALPPVSVGAWRAAAGAASAGLAAALEAAGLARPGIGLGCIVALYHRTSTSHQIREENRYRCC
jgi:hypothetical protein